MNYAKEGRAEEITGYKRKLLEAGYSPSSINGVLAAIRSYLKYAGIGDVHVRNVRVQRNPHVNENRMLEKKKDC